jgi:hypothetical protein
MEKGGEEKTQEETLAKCMQTVASVSSRQALLKESPLYSLYQQYLRFEDAISILKRWVMTMEKMSRPLGVEVEGKVQVFARNYTMWLKRQMTIKLSKMEAERLGQPLTPQLVEECQNTFNHPKLFRNNINPEWGPPRPTKRGSRWTNTCRSWARRPQAPSAGSSTTSGITCPTSR